jgi:hypothetical protein
VIPGVFIFFSSCYRLRPLLGYIFLYSLWSVVKVLLGKTISQGKNKPKNHIPLLFGSFWGGISKVENEPLAYKYSRIIPNIHYSHICCEFGHFLKRAMTYLKGVAMAILVIAILSGMYIILFIAYYGASWYLHRNAKKQFVAFFFLFVHKNLILRVIPNSGCCFRDDSRPSKIWELGWRFQYQANQAWSEWHHLCCGRVQTFHQRILIWQFRRWCFLPH